MKIFRLCALSLLFIDFFAQAFCCSHSKFVPRSQETNSSRRINFWDRELEVDDTCYSFWFVPEYTHSFRSKKIANHLFGGNCLVFSGSRVENRASKDIFADYLGLPSDFKSVVSFKPRIQNFLIDFGWKVNLDWIRDDVYLQLHAPFVHTRWDLKLCEKIIDRGTEFYPAGYLSGGNQRILRDKLPADVKTAFKGKTTFGDMQDPMRFGKIDCAQTKTEIAEIRTQLHWNMKDDEKYRWDAHVFLSAPTGTRVRSEYLFEPIVGNNHHWEIGFGLNGLREIWESEDQDRHCNFYCQATISHLFKTSQYRSFDLKNSGRGSRYMLLAHLDTPRDNILQVPANVYPENQYTGHLFPAINKTTLKCDISIGVQLDALIAFAYKRDSWTFDVGYNLWLRSKEKLHCRERFESDKFAIKGDSQLYGYYTPGLATLEIAVPLNATQSKATIYSAQADNSGSYNTDFSNKNVDNSDVAQESDTPGGMTPLTTSDVNDLGLPVLQPNVCGSNQAILLTNLDIDHCSALSPRASSSKFFLTCKYECDRRENWDPYFSIGFEIEFGHSCRALSQFGAWLRFGAAY